MWPGGSPPDGGFDGMVEAQESACASKIAIGSSGTSFPVLQSKLIPLRVKTGLRRSVDQRAHLPTPTQT